MAAKRISMRKIKEILRLKYEAQLTHRQIAKSLNISPGTVSTIVCDARACELSWPLPDNLGDKELEAHIYGNSEIAPKQRRYEPPDWVGIYQSLKQHKGVTKLLLWQEYRQQQGDKAYSYSRFCEHFRHWLKQRSLSMRQVHKAGDKLFVDYAGVTVPITCQEGQVRPAQIFIATLGASNYTYAEATWSQALPDWIGSHVRAFDFLGGVPAVVVPDNLKSAVSKAHRYDPDINPTYHSLAHHYNFAIIPARPRKPKDKAKVEVAVQIVERWILAKLRDEQFFSLNELNQAIQKLLVVLNDKPFQKLPGSRRSQFIQLDKPALKPLPKHRYQYREIKQSKVHVDYHVEVDGHYYSVPYNLAKDTVEVHLGDKSIAIYHQGQRIVTHVRSFNKGRHTTLQEHMPSSHKVFAKWSPGRFLNWAHKIGPAATQVILEILNKRQHPEQGYRSCLAILMLAKHYTESRLEKACEYAIALNAPYRKHIESILKNGMDKLPTEPQHQERKIVHGNIRGQSYYQ